MGTLLSSLSYVWEYTVTGGHYSIYKIKIQFFGHWPESEVINFLTGNNVKQQQWVKKRENLQPNMPIYGQSVFPTLVK